MTTYKRTNYCSGNEIRISGISFGFEVVQEKSVMGPDEQSEPILLFNSSITYPMCVFNRYLKPLPWTKWHFHGFLRTTELN